jgi:hypothetical protein
MRFEGFVIRQIEKFQIAARGLHHQFPRQFIGKIAYRGFF